MTLKLKMEEHRGETLECHKNKIKSRTDLVQIDNWREAQEDKVLKLYKNEWYDDPNINDIPNQEIHIIERMRTGRKCNDLEHYILKCNKFDNKSFF